ncbi:hypothetical protein DLM45_15345 [Hyphomicrobium methylovorum]|nr:hypothetical protein [Hyphomicrobium methylovorum]
MGKSQPELDFVDIDPMRDTRLFIDPYAIEIKDDEWSGTCGDHIRSFFQEVLDALKAGDTNRAESLVSHLHEPRETYLGLSKGRPKGRGVGDEQGGLLLNALRKSRAVATGVLSDLGEAELFVAGIGPDKVSDLTTNIIRGPLIKYTKSQCDLHGVLTKSVAHQPAWNVRTSRWESGYACLPVIRGKPVLLVPKYSVRRRLSLDSQEFYNHHMINYLQSEYQLGVAGLTHVFRKKITKKDVKATHPFIKDELAKFVSQHPEVLDRYKELKGAQGALGIEDFENDFDAAAFAQVLKVQLQNCPTGSGYASNYHSLMIGILTFLFYPHLIYPIKEKEIHEGRKRVDIVFTNAAIDGFFHTMLVAPQTRSTHVPIECKNYTYDIGNPEFDQISSRFGHQRGFLGFLTCRTDGRREKTIQTCRDTASDGRGFVIVLTDNDLVKLLDFAGLEDQKAFKRYLQRRYDELVL